MPSCPHTYRTARRVVGRRFYDYAVCELCGKLSLPGTQEVRVAGVDKAAFAQVHSLIAAGWEVLSESHGQVSRYTLVAPSALGASIG